MRILKQEKDMCLIQWEGFYAVVFNSFDGGRYEIWAASPSDPCREPSKEMIVEGRNTVFFGAALDLKEALQMIPGYVLPNLAMPKQAKREKTAFMVWSLFLLACLVALTIEAFFK